MKSLRQLLRQPGRSLAGFLLAALAAAILVICVGQCTAATLAREDLDDGYDTIALLSDTYFWVESSDHRTHLSSLPEEIQAWIDETIATRPDLIKAESHTGLLSAHIPELTADNYSHYEGTDYMGMGNEGHPYRCAMLEVTLTHISSIPDEETHLYVFPVDGENVEQTVLYNTSMLCVGTVENVIGLEEGWADPVGGTIALTVTAYSKKELDAMQLQVGQRYLVYGLDYSDTRGTQLESDITDNQPAYEEIFGPAVYVTEPYLHYSVQPIMEQIDCHMTICDYSALPWNTVSDGQCVTHYDQRGYHYYKDGEWYMTAMPAEEYIPDYCLPTIVPLSGAAEEYIASDEGALWQQALEELNISIHGFPVLAVDKLGYQVAFARQDARIVEGRDFSEQERTDGSKVCILSEHLARVNDLSIGDTIMLQSYPYDANVGGNNVNTRSTPPSHTAFPSGALYSRALGFSSEPETYTIVGVYRQTNAWQNTSDAYGFTPNTIFIPQSSVVDIEPILTGNSGLYYTLVLHNGKMAEFEKLQTQAGYSGLFVMMDQGYTEISTALTTYEETSAKILTVGATACAVILLLFVILFPLQQRRTLAIMHALGAAQDLRIRHVWSSSLALLLPGIALGGTVGAALWDQVAQTLMASLNIQIPLTADMTVTSIVLSLALLAGMAVILLLVSVGCTAENRIRR